VAAPVPNFISFEVVDLIEVLCRLGFLTTLRLWADVAVFGMKTVIYMAPEVVWAMKPLASADENATCKPFRAVVAVGSAVKWSDVIVAIGTIWRNSNLHGNLSRRFWSGCNHKTSSYSR
jgi:hypothetical protein